MEAQEWTREIEVDGKSYLVHLVKRPFREGLEVRIDLPGGTLRVAEMGLGEQALTEKIKDIIASTACDNTSSISREYLDR
ncbi:MAG: hypothetical protein ACK5GN_14320 [Pseudomonadota bacterium]|jgi:hypothetical protein